MQKPERNNINRSIIVNTIRNFEKEIRLELQPGIIMKTLYLHIGIPKTGTTSIQHFCHENRDILSQNGYFYPDFPFEYIYAGKYRNGSFLETRYVDREGIRHTDIEEEYFQKGLEITRELFMQHDNLIISNEGVWGACFIRKRGIPRMLRLQEDAKNAGYKVKIIVYLRRQDEYLLDMKPSDRV